MSQKWKEFEREVAKRFRRWFPDAHRGLQFQEGEFIPDVVGTNLPFYLECKTSTDGSVSVRIDGHDRSFAVADAVRRSALWEHYHRRMMRWRDENGGKDLPVVFVVRNCNVWRVIVPTEVWSDLTGVSITNIPYGATELVPWAEFKKAMDQTYGVEEAA